MPRLRAESGETLIETLIAISILGLAVVAILGALATSIRLTVVHRDQADANAFLLRSAEVLKNPVTNPWVDCANLSGSPAPYSATTGLTVPSGWSVSLSAMQYFRGPGASDWTSDRTDCQNNLSTGWSSLEHLQWMKLTLTTSGGNALSIDVMKGNS
jgi:type II secretory pathway pseudopilin PulG